MYKRRKISSKKTISGSGDQTSAIPREWLQIHNDNCILVEFPNEDNKIQTAYINWLSKTDQKNIQNIIKESTLIQINWPDQDIAAATVMRKKICNAKFCQYPIRVIATGKWTEMREKEKRILEKDVLETTKNNRSKHSRKILESDDENDLCKMKDNKKIKKKTKVSNIIKPICVTKSVKNPIDYDKSSDESSTSDEFEIFKLQEEKNEQINLNEKDETLEKLKRELEEERRKNTLLMQKPEEQNEKVIDKAETEQNDDSDASVGSERELLSQRSPSLLQRRKYENNLMKHNNYEKSKSPSSIQKQGNHFLGLENESNIFPSTSQMDSPDKSNLNESRPCYAKQKLINQLKNNDIQNLKQKLLEKELKHYDQELLSSKILQNMNKRTISEFSLGLAINLFSEAELAAGSVTGEPSNAMKDDQKKLVRPALDPQRMQYLYNKVYSRFGVGRSIRSKINKAISGKISFLREKFKNQLT